MLTLGDSLPILVKMKDFTYQENLVISYKLDNILITCGHCLPHNSIINFGKIISTSGFDTRNESKELGLIKLNKEFNDLIFNIIDKNRVKININNIIIPKNTTVFNYFNGNKKYGKIINLINNIDDLNNCNWYFETEFTKLNYPYYLISAKYYLSNSDLMNKYQKVFNYQIKDNKVGLLTNHGQSGSPWIIKKDKDYFIIGIHIGSIKGMNKYSRRLSDIAFVKVINSRMITEKII